MESMLIPFLLNFVSQDSLNLIALVTIAMLAMSEALSMIPSVKANGVFQLVYDVLGKFGQAVGKKVKANEPAPQVAEVQHAPIDTSIHQADDKASNYDSTAP